MTTLATQPRHRLDIPTRDPSREIVAYTPPAGRGFDTCRASNDAKPRREPRYVSSYGTPAARLVMPIVYGLPSTELATR